MNILRKLFKKETKSNQPIDSDNYNFIGKTKWESLEDLLEQNAGLSFEKQLIFAELIGENPWQFDMKKGTISFGNTFEFPVQVIGSLSFNNNSWMWGWANSKSGIPENLLKQAYKLKEIGEEKQITEFIEGHFMVEEGFEHKIGLMACGLFQSKSYYCANYGQGTLIVTLDSDEIPVVETNGLEKISTSFSQLISSIELNHKNTFKNYLIDRGFKLKIEENEIEGLKDGKHIKGEFDQSSRLINLSGKL